MLKGTLYIVATPIGHLDDITLRALNTLKAVDIILAEDTRHSQKLLSTYQIKKRLFSCHQHNEVHQVASLLAWLEQGLDVALISDAGTPLISDPGFSLVRAVLQANGRVCTIPGACAAIAALSISGLPTDRFIFEGFLPAKQSARIAKLEQLKHEHRTLIFYESVHRLLSCLQDMDTVWGKLRQLVLAKELTKHYEKVYRGNAEEILETLAVDTKEQQGEFVLLVEGISENTESKGLSSSEQQVVKVLLSQAFSVKQTVDIACQITSAKKNLLYHYALSLSGHETQDDS